MMNKTPSNRRIEAFAVLEALWFDILFQRVGDYFLNFSHLFLFVVAFLRLEHVSVTCSSHFELHVIEVRAFDFESESVEDSRA